MHLADESMEEAVFSSDGKESSALPSSLSIPHDLPPEGLFLVVCWYQFHFLYLVVNVLCYPPQYYSRLQKKVNVL